MKLTARISKRYHLKSRNDVSEWLWHWLSYNIYTHPIIDAAIYGYYDIVKYLHENGCDIGVCDEHALISAMGYEHLHIVKYLLYHGANVHIRDELMLRHAAEIEWYELMECLILHGADIDYAIMYTSKHHMPKTHHNLQQYLKNKNMSSQ